MGPDLEKVKAAVRKAAGKPETLARIRHWEKILSLLYRKDALTAVEPLSNLDETLNVLWNRRISVYSVGRLFREFGLDPGLVQPDVLSPDDVAEILDRDEAGRYGGADSCTAIYEEIHSCVGDLNAFTAVGSIIEELEFPELEETDRYYASDETLSMLADSVRESLEDMSHKWLQGIADDKETEELLSEMLDTLVYENGVSVIIEALPVCRELSMISVPEEEEAFRKKILSNCFSVLLEPWFDTKPPGTDVPVVLTTINLDDPENGNMFTRDLSRMDVIELGFRFLTLLYLESVKYLYGQKDPDRMSGS